MCFDSVSMQHASVTTVKRCLFLIWKSTTLLCQPFFSWLNLISFVKSSFVLLKKCIYGTCYQIRKHALYTLFAFGVNIAGLSYVTDCVNRPSKHKHAPSYVHKKRANDRYNITPVVIILKHHQHVLTDKLIG